MTLTQVEVYIGAVVIGALFGAYRGWRREIITMGILLATVIFLMLHGVETIASLSSGASASLVPAASAQGLSGGGSSTGTSTQTASANYTSNPPVVCTNPVNLDTVGVIVFFVMAFLAYRIGWRWGGPAKNSNERILGLIPGAINGGAIMFYLSHNVFKGETITLFSPTGREAGQYLPLVIIGGFVALVVLLLVASQTRRPSGTGGTVH